MKSILITTSSFGKDCPRLIEEISSQGLQVLLNPYGRKLTENEALELINRYQPTGIIAGVEPLTRNVLGTAENLKVISRCGIGMDSVNQIAAKELGITITNTPDAPTIPVAELTLGMILSLLRSINTTDHSIRQNKWERPMGKLLHGKTLGIMGCGRIGSHVARLASAFGCRVVGCDPFLNKHDCCSMLCLEDVLSESDIVSIHMPYSEELHHYIGGKQLEMMKPGALLINTARGDLVDEEALYQALKKGKLGGAALDCYEIEPYKGPLKEFDNVVLTAHIGSYAKEGRIMMEKQAVDNLLQELRKRQVIQ